MRGIRDIFADEQHLGFLLKMTLEELEIGGQKFEMLTHVGELQNGICNRNTELQTRLRYSYTWLLIMGQIKSDNINRIITITDDF